MRSRTKSERLPKTRNDAGNTVVRVMPAAVLEPGHANREVHFVVGNQDFIGLYAVEPRQRADGLAGQVHIGRRQEKPGVSAQDVTRDRRFP